MHEIFMTYRFLAMLSLFFLQVSLVQAGDDIAVIDSFESPNSFISKITIDGTKYLLKQKKASGKQFLVVRDALAAWIAKDLDIAHTVRIVPAKKKFPGKKNRSLPAVLLTIAPGKTIRSQPDSKYHHLALKQRNIDGIFSPDRWFTETIIHQMTWHPQLPVIIALDLFICNTDRHGDNLFYDSATDTFCAIDMDNIFRRDLSAIAVAKLKLMITRKKVFTLQEIKALISMKKTLQFLMEKYPVTRIIDKLHFFVDQAEFSKHDVKFTAKIAQKIARHKKTITDSRTSLHALIYLLDTIIKNFNQSPRRQ
jgi:hypothetical protein